MYCKNVITFEQINYKQSKNHYKQLQTILRNAPQADLRYLKSSQSYVFRILQKHHNF